MSFSDIFNGGINIVLLLAFLVPLVVIHEFGHFLVARRAGVTVHEFGIGFPPRALTFHKDKRGTIYTLNWLPIGGFVRLEGEEGESADSHAFVNQSLRTRLVILLAGVAMNFLLAFVIFTLIAYAADPVMNVRIGGIQPGSPAEAVGLHGGVQTGTEIGADGKPFPVYDQSGDEIVAIDGQRFLMFDSVGSPTAPLDYLKSHAGQQVTLTVRSAAGEERQVVVTLRVPSADQGALGITYLRFGQESIGHDILTAI